MELPNLSRLHGCEILSTVVQLRGFAPGREKLNNDVSLSSSSIILWTTAPVICSTA
jgi:hypothetical protein